MRTATPSEAGSDYMDAASRVTIQTGGTARSGGRGGDSGGDSGDDKWEGEQE